MEGTTPHLWRHPGTRRWYIVWQEAGQPRRRSTRTTRRDQADAALRTFLIEETGDALAWGPRRRLTVRAALEEWIEDRSRPRHGLQVGTLRSYRYAVRRVSAVLPPKLQLRDVRPYHLRKAFDRLESGGATAKEIAKLHRILRSAFAWLDRQGEIGKDPSRAVDMPKIRPTRRQPLDPQRYAELLAAVEHASQDAGEFRQDQLEELRDLLRVLWLSGMRSIEALRLRWSGIDLNAATWQVEAPPNKGGIRVQPIHQDLLPMLRGRRLRGGLGPFRPRLRRTWSRWKRLHPEWAGTSFHALRHAFVTRLAQAGNQAAASFLVGHSSAQMTQHYTHLTVEDARRVLDRL